MNRVRTKLITEEKDLKAFSMKCGEKLDLNYPLSYLKKANVRAFYDKNGTMVGGYMLAFEGPFRVIQSLPDHVLRESPWTTQEILDQSYEITGLWLDKKVESKSWSN